MQELIVEHLSHELELLNLTSLFSSTLSPTSLRIHSDTLTNILRSRTLFAFLRNRFREPHTVVGPNSTVVLTQSSFPCHPITITQETCCFSSSCAIGVRLLDWVTAARLGHGCAIGARLRDCSHVLVGRYYSHVLTSTRTRNSPGTGLNIRLLYHSH
jgi:hypothetical protein